MRTHFLNKILQQTWHMDRGAGRRVIAELTRCIGANSIRSERPDETSWGDPLPKMQIVNGVAIIPICGTLLVNVPDWVKQLGCDLTDANDIESEVTAALNNPEVEFIVQDIDS